MKKIKQFKYFQIKIEIIPKIIIVDEHKESNVLFFEHSIFSK